MFLSGMVFWFTLGLLSGLPFWVCFRILVGFLLVSSIRMGVRGRGGGEWSTSLQQFAKIVRVH